MDLLQDERFHNRGLHNFEGNLTQPRHRWYPFKEGFSAELVSLAIRNIENHETDKLRILDPFSGSGTTPVTAALHGHEAHALEVNPFCSFATRVKCLPRVWREKPFSSRLNNLLSKARKDVRPCPLERQSTFSSAGGSQKWLFNDSVLRAFSAVWRANNRIGASYNPVFRLAALRAAMACCNAKKDGKALRYYSDWQSRDYSAENFLENFRETATQFRIDTELARIADNSKIKVCTGDSRSIMRRLPASFFDLLITSPPYLNSMDYSDVYRPELFLGGFVTNNEDLSRIRLRTVRSHLQVNWRGKIDVTAKSLENPLAQLKNCEVLWNAKLPKMVEAYFHDMQRIFRHASRVLKPKAQAWIVVSTSAYAGIHIPVDLILAEIATQTEFELSGIYVMRSLRAAGQQQSRLGAKRLPLRESLIVLRRK
jgi:DNA modification methylase